MVGAPGRLSNLACQVGGRVDTAAYVHAAPHTDPGSTMPCAPSGTSNGSQRPAALCQPSCTCRRVARTLFLCVLHSLACAPATRPERWCGPAGLAWWGVLARWRGTGLSIGELLVCSLAPAGPLVADMVGRRVGWLARVCGCCAAGAKSPSAPQGNDGPGGDDVFSMEGQAMGATYSGAAAFTLKFH